MLLGLEVLECSPLGEPNISSFSVNKFRVKLKLDTPGKAFFVIMEGLR